MKRVALTVLFFLLLTCCTVYLSTAKKKAVYEKQGHASYKLLEITLNGKKILDWENNPIPLALDEEHSVTMRIQRDGGHDILDSVNYEFIQPSGPDVVCVQGGVFQKVKSDKNLTAISGKFRIAKRNASEGPLFFVIRSMRNVVVELDCIASH